MEEKLKDDKVKVLILYNPQNPIGKIHSKSDLKRIAKLAYENNVFVVSDEIHCDLTDPDKKYNPFATVSDIAKNNSISCFSPSKTFNLAGLKSAAICVPNDKLRKHIFAGLDKDGISDPNLFSTSAAIAAYTKGKDWLNELKIYIYNNKIFLKDFLKSQIPDINLIDS